MEKKNNLTFWQKNRTLIGVTVIFVGLATFFGFRQLLISSGAFQLALESAVNNESLQMRLGDPIQANFIVGGKIYLDGSGLIAKIKIPISGPNGSGLIEGKAKKISDEWIFSRLEVTLDDGDTFNLL
ncbi:MAG: cytochrome c oxidase assembly factor 1 family protein [Desulfobulbaceae bacterium]|nr:cytochrome c oxidase assembly factor 1 family protein [Desulfobulbaceae bacterium]